MVRLVAPHDGSNAATYVYDEAGASITVNGLGAHIGLAKVFNGGELASPADAKESIAYTITAQTDTTMTSGYRNCRWWLLEIQAR